MPSYTIGQTIYDHIISTDSNNIPVTAATFDNVLYRNGSVYTGATLNFSLIDSFRGIYQASFSSSTTGEYQIYSNNQTTNTIYISGIFSIKNPEDISTSIYIGY